MRSCPNIEEHGAILSVSLPISHICQGLCNWCFSFEICIVVSIMVTRQAPVLDRRAMLRIAPAGSRNEYGEWVIPSAPVQHEIWYGLRDWDIAPDPTASGVAQSAETEIITRYRRDVIVEALSGEIGGQTGHAFINWALSVDGVDFAITDAAELPQFGRRRFMKLICERSNA